MKRLSYLMFLLTLPLSAQTYVPYNDIALGNANGIAVVLSGANVRVCSVPTSTNPPCNTPLSNLRRMGTNGTCSTSGLANPLNADVSGNYSFCAQPGQYVVETSKSRFGTIRVPILVTSVAGQGGLCPSGQVMTGINPDGTPVCAPESTASVTPHALLGPQHFNTVAEDPPLQGDMIVGVLNAGETKWTAVPKGSASFCWQMDPTGTYPLWAACPSSASVIQPQTPPPPFNIPSGQAVAWSYPSTCNGFYGEAGLVTNPWNVSDGRAAFQCGTTGGTLSRYVSSPLGTPFYKIQWAGFTVPTMPLDAVIQHIYPVYIGVEIGDGTWINADQVTCESGLNVDTMIASYGRYYGGYFTSSSSMGNTAADITAADCYIMNGSSTAVSGLDTQSAQLFALAVYYTTATPQTTNSSSFFAFPYYSAINGVAPLPVTVADGSPIVFNATYNFLTASKVTLNHLAATRALNMSGLQAGGIYQFTMTQDATGGAALTGGTGCTWIVNNAATTTIPIDTTANASTHFAVFYGGTNCYVDYPIAGGGGGGGLADPGGNGIIKRTALNTTAVAIAGDVNTALGYTAANDSTVVHNTGAENINGVKSFLDGIVVPSGATADIGGLGFNGVSTEFVEITGGTAPTITAGCGTSPSIVGTDNAFTITGGTGTFSTCTVTFSRTWGHVPSCTVNNRGVLAATRATPTTTTVVIDSASNFAAGGKIDATCF